MNLYDAKQTVHYRQGFKIIEVDTEKTSYRGIPWKQLGNFGKRKLENLLVLKDTSQITKVIYA